MTWSWTKSYAHVLLFYGGLKAVMPLDWIILWSKQDTNTLSFVINV
jgi:hypothetical protein